ncbi:MAG: M48 family metalloprotease [Nitrososphaeria archaeon]
MSSVKTFSFTIDTELSPIKFRSLLEFIEEAYLKKDRSYSGIRIYESDGSYTLFFTKVDQAGKWSFHVSLKAGTPISVLVDAKDTLVPEGVIEKLKEDLFLLVQFFEERARRTTIYFAWVEGERIIPERYSTKRKGTVIRIFSESMLLLYVVFIITSVLLFSILGLYAPIILVAFQFILVLLSGKIIEKTGEWKITKENPKVTILQYQLPFEDMRDFFKQYGQDVLIKIKKEIHDKTLLKGRPVDCDTAKEVFSKYNLQCLHGGMLVKTINVYEIVRKGAEKFGISVPKIVVSPIQVPNAAAAGPGPRFGTMLITTGLLIQLKEDEILGVVGHELSHIKGRDTLAFFGLMSSEFILRFYVFYPLLIFFGIFYLILAFTVVYFIAKFFESKADLESAIRIGQPKALAEALKKIGFIRLLYSRSSSSQIQEWLSFEPHPPTYFRIRRLERLERSEEIKHPLLRSMKDNILDFISILKMI